MKALAVLCIIVSIVLMQLAADTNGQRNNEKLFQECLQNVDGSDAECDSCAQRYNINCDVCY
jgi:hypothetical protein